MRPHFVHSPCAFIDALERRRLLAALFWDAGGDGVQWFDPLNWSGDVLPGPADDVTIDVPGTTAVRLMGPAVVHSLVLREPLQILAGGTLETLTTAQCDASVELDGGLIRRGTWTFAFPAALVAGTNPASRLQEVVSVTGDVVLGVANANLSVVGSIAVNGTIRMIGPASRLSFNGTQTLSTGAIRFQYTQTTAVPEVLVVTGTLTLGDTVVVNIVPDGRGALNGSYINRGTIESIANTDLSIQTSTMVNQGHIFAGSGGSINPLSGIFRNDPGATITAGPGGTVALQGTWENNGTIVVNDGTLYLGGTVDSSKVGTIQRTGGTIRLNGVLDNTGRTFTPGPGVGPWVLDNGRIIGGTVNLSLSDTGVNPDNRFIGPMTFNGELNLGRLTLERGIDLNGTALIRNELTIQGSQTIAGGTWRFENPTTFPAPLRPTLHVVDNGTATLGPDSVIEAGYVALGRREGVTGAGTLVNEGVIELRPTVNEQLDALINPGNALVNAGTLRLADGADALVRPDGSGFLNQGLVQVGATNGQTRLVIDCTFSNTGTIDVNALVELRPPAPALLGAIADQTASGYNGGTWDGPGIRSSRAASTPGATDAVGYRVIADAAPFIRLRYTRTGDADTSGNVNLSDFNLLAAGFGTPAGARWDQGDFNYDRVVNLADFNLFAANFGGSIGAASSRSRDFDEGDGEEEQSLVD